VEEARLEVLRELAEVVAGVMAQTTLLHPALLELQTLAVVVVVADTHLILNPEQTGALVALA
jgi:hypothetical protein